MADTPKYLTLSCRTSDEGCKQLSNDCHGTDQKAPGSTGKRQRSHICDKMTAKCITQHKSVYWENTTEPEDPQTEITYCETSKKSRGSDIW